MLVVAVDAAGCLPEPRARRLDQFRGADEGAGDDARVPVVTERTGASGGNPDLRVDVGEVAGEAKDRLGQPVDGERQLCWLPGHTALPSPSSSSSYSAPQSSSASAACSASRVSRSSSGTPTGLEGLVGDAGPAGLDAGELAGGDDRLPARGDDQAGLAVGEVVPPEVDRVEVRLVVDPRLLPGDPRPDAPGGERGRAVGGEVELGPEGQAPLVAGELLEGDAGGQVPPYVSWGGALAFLADDLAGHRAAGLGLEGDGTADRLVVGRK